MSAREPRTETVHEIALIERLAGAFTRSSHQLNERHETDAELLRVPGSDPVLALTTDHIAEEIQAGLYVDAELIGWMTVMVNASDLSAVGARPLGLVLNETLPPDVGEGFLAALQRGIQQACDACGLHVLGGDTNFGPRLQMGGCALGVVPEGRPMTRRGCAPGDLLFASGPLGLGGAFALARLLGGSEADGERIPFRPVARLTEGQLLRPFASGCMDTSDGALPTLDELMRLNGVGFRFRITAAESLHPAAAAAASRARIPPWMLLAGPHGEYELLFTVPRGRLERFLAVARAREWRPLHLGEAVREPGLTLPIDGTLRQLDTTAVRNLFGEVGGDLGAYREGLARLAAAATTERARCAR